MVWILDKWAAPGYTMIYRRRVAIAVGMATVTGSRRVCSQFLKKKPLDFLQLYSCIWKQLRQKSGDFK